MNDCMHIVKLVAPVTFVNNLEKFADDRPFSLIRVPKHTLPNTLKLPKRTNNPSEKFKCIKILSLAGSKSNNKPNMKIDAPNVLEI